MRYNLTEFKTGLDELGISLSDQQTDQFIRYYELLIEWNKVMNLTGITEFEDVIRRHFLDSLTLVKVLPEINRFAPSENLPDGNVFRVMDLGTGAGFPGIPLKIAFPGLEIVLLDSLNKRIRFLDTVIGQLDLSQIRAVHGRAEELARKKEYRQSFDLCVSRAVSNLSTLAEYCLPFVKTGGIFVSYKSADADEEIKQADRAIRLVGGEISRIEKFSVPGSDLGRSLICIAKKKDTPKAYPRKAGTPGKDPL